MRVMARYGLVLSFIVVVTLGSGCSSYYVGKELPSLDWRELDSVESKQPVALYFGYMVHGGKEAYLSKMWEKHFQRALLESGLFSSVILVGLHDSKPPLQRLDLIMTEQYDAMQVGGGSLATGLTLALVKSTQTSRLELSARYTNPGTIPTAGALDIKTYQQVRDVIAAQGNRYHHVLHSTLGLIGSTPEGTQKSSGDEAAYQVARDLTAHVLNDLQKRGYLK